MAGVGQKRLDLQNSPRSALSPSSPFDLCRRRTSIKERLVKDSLVWSLSLINVY